MDEEDVSAAVVMPVEEGDLRHVPCDYTIPLLKTYQSTIYYDDTDTNNWTRFYEQTKLVDTELTKFARLIYDNKTFDDVKNSADYRYSLQSQFTHVIKAWKDMRSFANAAIDISNQQRNNIHAFAIASIDTILSQRPPGRTLATTLNHVDVRNPALGNAATYLNDDAAITELLQLSPL